MRVRQVWVIQLDQQLGLGGRLQPAILGAVADVAAGSRLLPDGHRDGQVSPPPNY